MEGREIPGVPTRTSRRGRVLAVLIVALVSLLALAGHGSAATVYDAEELQFLELLNEYRAQNGLRPVILSDTLTVAAEHHSEDMARYGFFAHNTEASSYYSAGSEPWDRMEAEGYRYNTAKGENLAVGYETAEQAMQAWKESPSHNEAMLDGAYRVMGVARINDPESVHGWYWTTDFGGYVDPGAPGGPSDGPPEDQGQPPAEESGAEPPRGDDRPADTGVLEGGRLEAKGIWTQKARDGAGLIIGGRARLGAYHDGVDDLRQRIRVTRGAKLAYDVRVTSGGGDPEDRMLVRLTTASGKQIGLLERYTGTDAGEWRRERLDLSRFAGRNVFLSFHARTDSGRLTTFYVDDLALKR